MIENGRISLKSTSRSATFAVFGITLASSVEGNGMSLVGQFVATDLGHQDMYPWIYTFFMLGSVAGIASMYRLSTSVSNATLLRSTLIVALLGGGLSGAAWSMPAFLTGRAVQGVAVGALTVLMFTWAVRVFSGQRRTQVLSLIGGAGAIGSAIGPGGSAIFLGIFSWRVFIAVVTMCIVALGLVFTRAKETADLGDGETLTTASIGRPFWIIPATSGIGISQATQATSTATLGQVGLAVGAASVIFGIGRGLPGWNGVSRILVLGAALFSGIFAVATYGFASYVTGGHGAAATAVVLSSGAVGWLGSTIWHPSTRPGTRALVFEGWLAMAILALGIAVSMATHDTWPIALVWLATGFVFGRVIPDVQSAVYATAGGSRIGTSSVLQIAISLVGAWTMTSSTLFASTIQDLVRVPRSSGLLLAAAIGACVIGVLLAITSRWGAARREPRP